LLAEYAAGAPLEVLRRLESGPRGLEEAQAQARLASHSENAVPFTAPPPWWKRLLGTARNPFVVVLLCLDAVSAAAGDEGGAVVIGAMVAVSCALRFHQEHRSDRAAAALRAMVTTTATVIRRAAPGAAPVAREVPVDQLVPGDVVRLTPGDMVPADLRLLRSADLAVSQSPLTGESLPASKSLPSGTHLAAGSAAPRAAAGPAAAVGGASGPPAGTGSIFDCAWLCLMGSNVVSGSGTGVVVATGGSTYFGATHQDVRRGVRQTAFDRGVKGVSRLLVSLMVLCVPALVAVSTLVHQSGSQRFLFAVCVAVGLTPEMLPLVVTTALARGSGALARSG
jgi:P-type Mg2+ transporter